MSEDGYGVIRNTPEFHFGTEYEAKFEATEESRKEWEALMDEHDKDALKFYDVFQNDVSTCLSTHCEGCSLLRTELAKTGECALFLENNVKKMIINQKRMYMKFMEQRKAR